MLKKARSPEARARAAEAKRQRRVAAREEQQAASLKHRAAELDRRQLELMNREAELARQQSVLSKREETGDLVGRRATNDPAGDFMSPSQAQAMGDAIYVRRMANGWMVESAAGGKVRASVMLTVDQVRDAIGAWAMSAQIRPTVGPYARIDPERITDVVRSVPIRTHLSDAPMPEAGPVSGPPDRVLAQLTKEEMADLQRWRERRARAARLSGLDEAW